MASLRKLNRRLLRWQRYARRTYWNPRVTPPTWQGRRASIAFGHRRGWDAREKERERRQCHRFYTGPCFDCGLPDPYDGHGDGIGSCECPRCQECGAPPEGCDCAWTEDLCDCCEPDDDAGHGDDWPGAETTTAFQEAGLL